jgi:hypothetical protein
MSNLNSCKNNFNIFKQWKNEEHIDAHKGEGGMKQYPPPPPRQIVNKNTIKAKLGDPALAPAPRQTHELPPPLDFQPMCIDGRALFQMCNGPEAVILKVK